MRAPSRSADVLRTFAHGVGRGATTGPPASLSERTGGAMVSILGSSSFGGGGGDPLRCSFCGRRDVDVGHLVRARGVYICDGCVAQARRRSLRHRPAGSCCGSGRRQARLPTVTLRRRRSSGRSRRCSTRRHRSRRAAGRSIAATTSRLPCTSWVGVISRRTWRSISSGSSPPLRPRSTSRSSCGSSVRPVSARQGTRCWSATSGRCHGTPGVGWCAWLESNAPRQRIDCPMAA
jgi:hypothetical protein